jgi:hypothetical protein
MRSFLINKNLAFYYWLKKRIGKGSAFWVANTIEKAILIFGREEMPYFDKNGMLTEPKEMLAYKIYWHDGIGRDHLIGITRVNKISKKNEPRINQKFRKKDLG